MHLPSSTSIKIQNNNQIICVNNKFATAEISLYGAQVISFIPKHDQRERLWLSPHTHIDGSENIRGGIPVCWPWFASQFPNDDTSLPAHGFVRSQYWELTNAEDNSKNTRLLFRCPQVQGKGFEFQSNLTLEVLIGDSLTVTLMTENKGDVPFEVTSALHTYFAVTNIHNVHIIGLEGEYRDKTRAMQTFLASDKCCINEETDRIQLNQPNALTLIELDTHSESASDTAVETTISATGHDSVVVWNPWKEKTKQISNIPDEGYQQFVCIEAAVTQGKMIKPQEIHCLQQIIK